MASDKPLGSSENPAYLDPFTEIVGFKAGGVRYIVLKLSVYRRILSRLAHAGNLAVIGGTEPPVDTDPDTIREVLLSYTLSRAWPWGPGIKYPADEPFDVPPNEAVSGAGMKVTGMPTLPDRTFGNGLPGGGGAIGTSQIQAFLSPGGRFAAGGAGGPPFEQSDDIPAPPSFGGRTAAWASATAQFELYAVSSEFGGATLVSAPIAFGSVRLQVGKGERVTHYRAIASAAVPREEGTASHNPPFTGPVFGQNANNRSDIWVLCKRYSP